MLLVGIDPPTFRTRYGVPGNVPVLGPYPGSLQGGGETLSLQMPDAPDLDTNTGAIFIPYIDVDVVHYNDKAPWPLEADGLGASLEKPNASSYGNDPINWRASSSPSPGLDNTGNRAPFVVAGADLNLIATNAPTDVVLSGSAKDDNFPNPLVVTWTQVSGPASVWFDNIHQTNTTVHFPGVGTYVLRLNADDGAVVVSDDVTFSIQRTLTSTPVTLVSKGSVWKYLDNGTDQGSAWRAPGFADGTWGSGCGSAGIWRRKRATASDGE